MQLNCNHDYIFMNIVMVAVTKSKAHGGGWGGWKVLKFMIVSIMCHGELIMLLLHR